MIEMAERILERPVRLATPRGLDNMPVQMEQPEYTTAVGLLLYAARFERLEQQRGMKFGERLAKFLRGEGWN
jgi:cell division protein FtsA